MSSQIFELYLAVTLCSSRRRVNCSEITEISAALGPSLSDKGCQIFPSSHLAIRFILLTEIKYAKNNCVGLVDIGQTDWNGTKNWWA
jgi:hypothetical protein